MHPSVLPAICKHFTKKKKKKKILQDCVECNLDSENSTVKQLRYMKHGKSRFCRVRNKYITIIIGENNDSSHQRFRAHTWKRINEAC